MLKFEAILIDPSPGEIAERLADAADAANKRCRTRLLKDDPAKWRKFARQVGASPEGFDLFRGGKGGVPGTQLVAAWWTDHIGRKHVVLRGRRIEHDTSKVLLDKSELARRPPLWHCYPQHLYQRFLPTAGEPQIDWIAVCGCGATGTPESLGWMGETCGPCHDRREEAGDDALRDNRGGWLHAVRNPFQAVAFSRDGQWVAAVEYGGPVSAWDLQNPCGVQRHELARDEIGTTPYLAFAGPHNESVVLSEPSVSHPGTVIFRRDDSKPYSQLACDALIAPAFSTSLHGSQLIFDNALSDLILVSVPEGNLLKQVPIDSGFWLTPPTHPSARFVCLVTTEGVRFHSSESLKEIARVAYRIISRAESHTYQLVRAAYHESTQTVFVGRHNDLEVYDLKAENYGGSFSLYQIPVASYQNHPTMIRAMALSADERHLFVAAGERLVVFDTVTHAAVAAFAWHLGPIACLAVSPDGRTLATTGVEGVVKLWPMDRLLAP
ncbi:WD40 repeat domain-containing protein [Limnoglobus roseus]|uniref:WD40 repeat domain-containing protein n=1 Tax=Limnoglobus roseus TaxID=2598579 RepID=A0A5C1A9W1_9BACT|nr:WD40 repeat domain-containing protein [Limnoglobus roseus]QEL15520.1 WD40 repeat domain-containing protein [Limnoglobus roseus]